MKGSKLLLTLIFLTTNTYGIDPSLIQVANEEVEQVLRNLNEKTTLCFVEFKHIHNDFWHDYKVSCDNTSRMIKNPPYGKAALTRRGLSFVKSVSIMRKKMLTKGLSLVNCNRLHDASTISTPDTIKEKKETYVNPNGRYIYNCIFERK